MQYYCSAVCHRHYSYSSFYFHFQNVDILCVCDIASFLYTISVLLSGASCPVEFVLIYAMPTPIVELIGVNRAKSTVALSLPSIVFIKTCPLTFTSPSVEFITEYPTSVVLMFPVGSINVPLPSKVCLLTF